MSIFPTEPASSNVASKHDELEVLYACVSKVCTPTTTIHTHIVEWLLVEIKTSDYKFAWSCGALIDNKVPQLQTSKVSCVKLWHLVW